MPKRRERLSETIERERADARFHVELTWCSVMALLIVAGAAAGLVWAGLTLLPPLRASAGSGWGQRLDYRLIGGIAAVALYPWLHGSFRRLAGRSR